MTKITEYLNRLKEIEGKATKGPWGWDGRYLSTNGAITHHGDEGLVLDVDTACSEEDAEFIAASRSSIPILIQALEKATTTLGLRSEMWASECLATIEGLLERVK